MTVRLYWAGMFLATLLMPMLAQASLRFAADPPLAAGPGVTADDVPDLPQPTTCQLDDDNDLDDQGGDSATAPVHLAGCAPTLAAALNSPEWAAPGNWIHLALAPHHASLRPACLRC